MRSRDVRQVLRDLLPATSEFRPASRDDDAEEIRLVKRGRRVVVPNSTVPDGFWVGTQWIDPHVQPAPTSILRCEALDHELPTTVYLAWDASPGVPLPQEPEVYALVRWGVGGVTYERQIDVHRGPARRLALAANWVEIVALYSDGSESIEAGATVDVIAGIASGPCDPNYWTGTWVPRPLALATDLKNLTSQPTAVLAVAGTLLTLPGGITSAYVVLVDSVSEPMVGDKVIPGGASPLLGVGDSFAFCDTDEPAIFADWGLGWAISDNPRVVNPPAGGSSSASVALKITVAALGAGAQVPSPPPPT